MSRPPLHLLEFTHDIYNKELSVRSACLACLFDPPVSVSLLKVVRASQLPSGSPRTCYLVCTELEKLSYQAASIYARLVRSRTVGYHDYLEQMPRSNYSAQPSVQPLLHDIYDVHLLQHERSHCVHPVCFSAGDSVGCRQRVPESRVPPQSRPHEPRVERV